jgi:hypothetical protein
VVEAALVAGEVLALEEGVHTEEDHLGIREVAREDIALVADMEEDTALVVDRVEDMVLGEDRVEDMAPGEDILLVEIALLVRYIKYGI